MADSQFRESRAPGSLDAPHLLADDRERGADLAALRQEVIAAANGESEEIVGTARTEVRRIILQARHDLAILRDQVQATIGSGSLSDAGPRTGGSPRGPRGENEPDESIPGSTAVSRVLEETRSEVTALSLEAEAFRGSLSDPWIAFAANLYSVPDAAASLPDAASSLNVRPRSGELRGRLWILPVVTVVTFIGSCWWALRSSDERPAQPSVGEMAPVGAPSATLPAAGAATREIAAKPTPSPAPQWTLPAQRQNEQGTRIESLPRSVEPGPITQPDSVVDAVSNELTASAGRWLEAYYAQDRARMAAFSSAGISVTDQRPEQERLPSGLSNVRRTVASPRVQVFGSAAILTARITERAQDPNGQSIESVSLISQTWTRRDGAWQLHEVRLVSAAAVDRAFRR